MNDVEADPVGKRKQRKGHKDAVRRCDGKRKKTTRGELTIAARLHAVDSQSRVLLLGLSGFDVGQCFDWTQARVFGQSHWHRVECIGERAHRILFEAGAL
jgi:hypothetical protein